MTENRRAASAVRVNRPDWTALDRLVAAAAKKKIAMEPDHPRLAREASGRAAGTAAV